MLNRPARENTEIATVPLQWFGADGAPEDRVVLFEPPCALRHQALLSLRSEYEIAKECADLTTVLTAARKRIGVTPLARLGPPHDGLRPLPHMPAMPDVTLYATTSDRVDVRTKDAVFSVLRSQLRGSVAAR